jgi:hypothetical protein
MDSGTSLSELTDLVELVGPPAVASRLDLARSSAVRLMEAGLAGRLYTDGQRVMVERELVEDLAIPVTDLDTMPPALVVRVGPPQRDTEEAKFRDKPRKWYGWNSLAHDKTDQRAGISRWWEIRDPDKLRGQLFVATVSGFTVDVARIDSQAPATPHPANATWELHIVDPSDGDAAADAWRGIRVKTPGGGAILRHRLD